MSTVVAIRDKDKIIMGSDSQMTVDNFIMLGCKKIIVDNGWLIGFVGSGKEFTILKNELCLTEYEDAYSIVNQAEVLLKDYVENMKAMIIAKGNKMWFVASELSVTEITSDVFAIGTGGDFALGSLVSSSSNKDSVYRLKTALTVASNLDIYTGGEIQIYETENTQ